MKCKYCKTLLGHNDDCILIKISNEKHRETQISPVDFEYEGLKYKSFIKPVSNKYSFRFIFKNINGELK